MRRINPSGPGLIQRRGTACIGEGRESNTKAKKTLKNAKIPKNLNNPKLAGKCLVRQTSASCVHPVLFLLVFIVFFGFSALNWRKTKNGKMRKVEEEEEDGESGEEGKGGVEREEERMRRKRRRRRAGEEGTEWRSGVGEQFPPVLLLLRLLPPPLPLHGAGGG